MFAKKSFEIVQLTFPDNLSSRGILAHIPDPDPDTLFACTYNLLYLHDVLQDFMLQPLVITGYYLYVTEEYPYELKNM